MGESFHLFTGVSNLALNLSNCTSGDTENQYLMRMIPDLTSNLSKVGTALRKSTYSSSVQKPITFSTPALLYQLLSKRTISPPAGRWATYFWKYHWDFSLSDGVGRAATLQNLGLKCSVILLITPPFPAVSRPSKTTAILAPVFCAHAWTLISSCYKMSSSLK